MIVGSQHFAAACTSLKAQPSYFSRDRFQHLVRASSEEALLMTGRQDSSESTKSETSNDRIGKLALGHGSDKTDHTTNLYSISTVALTSGTFENHMPSIRLTKSKCANFCDPPLITCFLILITVAHSARVCHRTKSWLKALWPFCLAQGRIKTQLDPKNTLEKSAKPLKHG